MTALVAQRDMVMVWPLRPGIWGLNAVGAPSLLEPGKRGWMHREKAVEAERNGEVQLPVGKRMEDLSHAFHTAEAALTPEEVQASRKPLSRKQRRRRTYRRRDMEAEQEPVPFIHGSPASADAG